MQLRIQTGQTGAFYRQTVLDRLYSRPTPPNRTFSRKFSRMLFCVSFYMLESLSPLVFLYFSKSTAYSTQTVSYESSVSTDSNKELGALGWSSEGCATVCVNRRQTVTRLYNTLFRSHSPSLAFLLAQAVNSEVSLELLSMSISQQGTSKPHK